MQLISALGHVIVTTFTNGERYVLFAADLFAYLFVC